MPRLQPHPLALFSLKPYNERAKAVVAHPINDHFISTLDDGTLALDIGHIRSKSGDTLALLGRGDTDIFVEGSSIAKVQCSFEIDLHTDVIMLYDRSHGQTTQIYGENATPFEYGRPRKVVVQEKLNTIIGMGGEGRDLVQFELEWHQNPVQTMEKVKNREYIRLGYEDNPRLARTIEDEADTVLPSRRVTRLHTPGPRQPKMRYAKIGDMLGVGQFAEVYKAVDVDSGKLMAVKILKPPLGATKQQQEGWRQSVYYAFKRKVENLAKINHPYIVDYIASQGWGGPKVEIFMGLKEGTLESLIESGSYPVPDAVFHQMLQALDCLALNDIVHRDVKPANILYVTRPDSQYQFQLGDFGLCNRGVSAHTFVGSPLYMAPEFYQQGEQTYKVDVWSLFVTMLWLLDVRAFRQTWKQFKSPREVHEVVLFAASSEDIVSKIREMAIVNPEERASAAQMLVKCFNGVGLSTPQNQVPALNTSPAIAETRELVPAPVPLTTKTAQKLPKGMQKNRNIFAAATQHRVEKARYSLQAQPQRQVISPMTEKRLGQALRPVITEMSGTFPSDNINATAEKRKRSGERLYYT
ncbi:kinase-like protein [Zopfia rhizophila CBS 207.26]|uniref:Kinase-like protein n=1 Tax=Zopfia rhizophila CBS 207.26 TaxID=1314779 RepID=A0A6A6DAV4_9PEZI|nr:kinase-like protein [Zopfia rhizophila CBS 207.26]